MGHPAKVLGLYRSRGFARIYILAPGWIPWRIPSSSFDKNMYHVYFLLLKNLTIYKGLTNDLERRYHEHKNGKVKSTKNRRPLKLIGYETYAMKSDAERRERFLKTNEGRKLFYKQYRDILKRHGIKL